MSGLRKRTTLTSTPEEKPSPLSTSKFKDRQSGLTYNYEDRFSKMKAFKTFLLMTFLTLSIFYILYELYKVIWNVIVDIYVYDIKHTGNFSHPHFRRNVWIAEIKDLLVISIKGIGLYAVFRMLNSRLLLFEFQEMQEGGDRL
jgi:hypothetical protein